MKRRLRRMYLAGVLAVTVAAVLTLTLLVAFKLSDTRRNLLSILSAASAWTEDSTADLFSLTERISQSAPPLRVTFLLPQGIVLADSEGSAEAMENHIQRPEIVAALAGETTAMVRYSQTLHTLTMYAAAQLSPRLILRLSYPMSDITRVVLFYAAGFVLLFGVLLGVYRRTMRAFSNDLVAQLNSIERLLTGALTRDTLREDAFFEELRPSMQSICYQIEKLQKDLVEIERTQRMRRDFAANASHELKSPLTSIQGFAELLAEGMADTPEERRECLDAILSEAARMRAVIDDILLLSRAEMKRDERAAMVDVAAIAREVALALKGQCHEKHISIAVEGALSLQAVEKDVWEILYNLMSNAVRYGKPDGHVRVTLEEGRLCVEDDGIGIEAEHLPLIFEQFYRVDKGRSREAGGTGLGLSIAAQLVRKHGGTLWAESEPGQGSRFVACFVRSL